jgi:hypothetical protein
MSHNPIVINNIKEKHEINLDDPSYNRNFNKPHLGGNELP